MASGTFTVRDQFIPFSPPNIGEEEIAEVVDTLRTDWITTGPKTRRFEQEFCEAFGCPAALAVNSCTAGLHISLATLGIGLGDEVITTPHTFCSTVNVIEHVGAKPILVDVLPDTLNISPSAIAAAITDRTKAIMPVHYAGHPCEMDEIQAIADRHGIHVIEDAAHPVSGKYKGRTIGSGTNPTSFSFYATKNMTTAEGGMLTGDPDFIARAKVVSLHGMSKDAWKRYDKAGGWWYDVILPGFKYNMTDLQASLGLGQLRKLSAFQARRREIVARYHDAFGSSPFFEIPVERPEVESSWHLYVLRLNPEAWRIDRNQFIEELKARNIGTSVHYIPVHIHPFYAEKYGFRQMDFPVCYTNFERMVSMPLSAKHTDEEIDYIIEATLDLAERFRA
ncbi:MAG: DegT/DnrJ/EryC1/StrS aminotransferase family protein [Fimbriimonadaceae bacterium]|jgi:dTDP-4-amino-4,6-dideoxygalactose transaminase|nr:DegT/DnrJ/EryC1/StrS aminotransferase family protein [Fimbriimonadaceae bacterium]